MDFIEQQAIALFEKNLLFLKQKHENVYLKVSILNQAMADGTYKENYALEYKESYFDILDLKSGSYLYAQNSIAHAKQMAQQVNYKKNDGVIEGFYNIRPLSDAEVEIFDKTVNLKNSLFATAKIISYNKKVTSKNDEMREIFKYIFCGIGLGLHITHIQEKIHAKLLFIMEKNLEIFRLSMFVTDYANLSANATLFFSIMEEKPHAFNDFFTQAYTHNHYIKYSVLSQDNIQDIKEIQESIVQFTHHTRPYAKALREFLKAPEYLVEKFPFINLSYEHLQPSPLANKPILLIASGPSLDRNSKWLQENKDKFFIICVLSSIKTLHKLGVAPNIVAHIDSESDDVRFFHQIDMNDFFKNTIFICSSVVAKTVINKVPPKHLYFVESASNYKKGAKIVSVPSIGETAYFLTLIFGANHIYLLGLDLALDPQTKSNHTAGHHEYKEISDSSHEELGYTLHDTISYTKGNFLDKVPTTPNYQLSIIAFSAISNSYLSKECKVYNLNNGAFLEGASPLHTDALDTTKFKTLDKEKIFAELKTFFDAISSSELTQVDMVCFEKQINEAKRLVELVKRFELDAPLNSYPAYIMGFYTLYKELLHLNQSSSYDINVVLSLYMQTIASYIFDIFNTKQVVEHVEHIQEVHRIVVEQLKKILNLYITAMDIYIEWAKK